MPAGYDYGGKLSIPPAGLAPARTAASLAAPHLLTTTQHIALVTVDHVSVLVSWNSKHIVNLGRIRAYLCERAPRLFGAGERDASGGDRPCRRMRSRSTSSMSTFESASVHGSRIQARASRLYASCQAGLLESELASHGAHHWLASWNGPREIRSFRRQGPRKKKRLPCAAWARQVANGCRLADPRRHGVSSARWLARVSRKRPFPRRPQRRVAGFASGERDANRLMRQLG